MTTERERGFYDADGNPITVTQWAEGFEDWRARVLQESTVVMPDHTTVIVRTSWHGMHDPMVGSQLFGTAVFTPADRHDGRIALPLHQVAGYDTHEQALQGHAEIVVMIRGGTIPPAT